MQANGQKEELSPFFSVVTELCLLQDCIMNSLSNGLVWALFLCLPVLWCGKGGIVSWEWAWY